MPSVSENEIGNALGIALLGSVLTVVFRIVYPGSETGIGEVIDNSGIDSGAFVPGPGGFPVRGVVRRGLPVGVVVVAHGNQCWHAFAPAASVRRRRRFESGT